MLDLCRLIFGMVIDLLRSRVALEAEILVLRQQINVHTAKYSCVELGPSVFEIARRLPAHLGKMRMQNG